MINLENYKEEELTITVGKANLYGLLIFVPFGVIFGLSYFFLWNDNLTKEVINSSLNISGIIFIIILLNGIIIHELIHGISWSLFTKQGFKSIKFGILWKFLTPYCHCNEPLFLKQYVIGAIMPAVIPGFISSIVSLINGHIGFFVSGLFFTLAAGGDFLILYLLRNQSLDNLIQDHPTKIGCSIYRLDRN